MKAQSEIFLKRIEFDRALKIGDAIEVRWTAGSFGHFRATGKVAKINAASVRVKIDHDVPGQWGGYPAGHVIVVPREFNVANGNPVKTWAHFNGVFPIEEAK